MNNRWELICLELDIPSKLIGNYFDENFPLKPTRIKAKRKRYSVPKNRLTDIVQNAIDEEMIKSGRPTLTLYGHGDLHHYTYGLCRVLADRRSSDYGYIHFDQHNDMHDSETKDVTLDCGRFVRSIKKDSNASQVLTIGAHGSYHRIPKTQITEKELTRTLRRLPRDVYLSFDLDVMHYNEIKTGWPWGGGMDQGTLLRCIRTIKREKNIIGADILGLTIHFLNPFVYMGMDGSTNRGLSLYRTIAAELMGLQS